VVLLAAAWQEVNPDYTRRPEPSDVLADGKGCIGRLNSGFTRVASKYWNVQEEHANV
jgi:hypothetical protein